MPLSRLSQCLLRSLMLDILVSGKFSLFIQVTKNIHVYLLELPSLLTTHVKVDRLVRKEFASTCCECHIPTQALGGI